MLNKIWHLKFSYNLVEKRDMPKIVQKEQQVNTSSLKEKGFNLSLPTLVKGKTATGDNFEEKTVLSYISHSGTSFWLANNVLIDSKLKLIIDLPPKLSEGKELKLIINGNVIFVESAKNQNAKQRVSLKFENKYIIDENRQP